MGCDLDSEDHMSDTLKRVLRTFVISFVALFVPSVLGFLGELTKWASARGQSPFPDLSVLGYAGVIAISAGLIAVLNLVVNLFEDAAGKSLPGFLSRPVKPKGAEVPTVITNDEVDVSPADRPPQHVDRDTRSGRDTPPW